MSPRVLGWVDEKIGNRSEIGKKGARTRKERKEEEAEGDVDLDLSEFGLGDDEPKKATKVKRTKKKRAKKTAGADDDLDDYGLADDEPKKAKKKRSSSSRKRTKAAKKRGDPDKKHMGTTGGPVEDDYGIDDVPWEPQDKTHAAAAELGIDLASECPVCRSLDPCECEEEDRSFIRRTRFEEDVKKVARCPRCRAPLSVVYLPRANSPTCPAEHRLPEFVAVWACACCHAPTLAATLRIGR